LRHVKPPEYSEKSQTIAGSRSAEKAIKYLAGKTVLEKLETTSGETFGVENKGCNVCENKNTLHLNQTDQQLQYVGKKSISSTEM